MADYHAWHYGPNGEAQIFTDPKDVPSGWLDHPNNPENPGNKHAKGAPKAPKAAKPAKDDTGGDELPGNVMKLKAIARDEKIDLGTAAKAADIKAVILAARAEKAG